MADIRLICGDALAVPPTLEGIDAVVTDPPYGIGRDGKQPSTSRHGGHKGYAFCSWDKDRPSKETFDAILRSAPVCILWGGNYFADLLPPSSKWLVWDKGQRIDQADAELAWTNCGGPVRVLVLNRVALMKDGAVHPTQKPLALMKWCLSFLPEECTVLDPYMGSG